MHLLAFNHTGSTVTLAGGAPRPVLPASAFPPERGAAVDVTSELHGIPIGEETAIQAQIRSGLVELRWDGLPKYSFALLSPNGPIVQNTFVYRPGETDCAPNVFTDFNELWAVRKDTDGPGVIQIDNSIVPAPIIPPRTGGSGIYDFGTTALCGMLSGGGMAPVSTILADGVRMSQLYEVRDNLVLESHSSAPVMVWDDPVTAFTILERGAGVGSAAGHAPFLSVDPGIMGQLVLELGGAVYNLGAPAIGVQNGAGLGVMLLNASMLNDNTVIGPAGAMLALMFFSVSAMPGFSQVAFAGTIGNMVATSAMLLGVSMDPADWAAPPGLPQNTNEALYRVVKDLVILKGGPIT